MARSLTTPFDLPDPLAGGSASGPNWTQWANEVDPTGQRYQSAQSWMPQQQYGYGNPGSPGVEFDPLPKGESFDTISQIFGSQTVGSGIDSWMQQAHPELYSFTDPGLQTNVGAVGDLGGEWANVDKWDKDIVGAAKTVQAETGVYVPPNVVKAIMQIESGGDPSAGPAYGLMQLTGSTLGNWTQDQLDRMKTDPQYAIYAGTKELALRFKDAQAQNKDYGWQQAAIGYYSGHYVPTGANDAASGGSGISDQGYGEKFTDYWNQLVGKSGVGGTTAKPNTAQFNAIWGGYDAPITQEFGMTDFAANSDYAKTAYAYTSEYSTNGQVIGHAGVDVGVSYGTPLYSPASGTVILSGGTGFYCDSDGNGCGNGVGELAIQYANGDQIILGHMSQITAKVGDTVQPGQFVGYSGSENGAHVHVEYRRWVGACTNGYNGSCTDSGWEAVDPRGALTGVFSGAYGAAGTGPVLAAGADDWSTFMKNASLGLPVKGAATVGGFHDWLRKTMGVGTAPTVDTNISSDPNRWVWGTPTPPVGGGSNKT